MKQGILRPHPINSATRAEGRAMMERAAAARLLGIGRTTFRRWAAMAGIKPVEVFPKCFRYRRHEVEEIARRAGAVA